LPLDPKGDRFLRETLRLAAERMGVPFRCWSPQGTAVYNPFARSGPTEVTDKALAGHQWTEPHYELATQRLLLPAASKLLGAALVIDLVTLTAELRAARLGDDSDTLTEQVLTNVSYAVVHREADPDSAERLARMAGTRAAWVTTEKFGGKADGWLGQREGTRTREREFIVLPDQVKSLGVGRAVLIQPATKTPGQVVRIFGPDLRLIRRGRKRLVPVAELERWTAENASRVLGERVSGSAGDGAQVAHLAGQLLCEVDDLRVAGQELRVLGGGLGAQMGEQGPGVKDDRQAAPAPCAPRARALRAAPLRDRRSRGPGCRPRLPAALRSRSGRGSPLGSRPVPLPRPDESYEHV
jgi:hypothetical protein